MVLSELQGRLTCASHLLPIPPCKVAQQGGLANGQGRPPVLSTARHSCTQHHTDQKFLLTGMQEPQCLSSAWLPRKGGLPERRDCHGAGASSADSQLRSRARVAGCWAYALPTQNALSVGQKSDAMPADSVLDL